MPVPDHMLTVLCHSHISNLYEAQNFAIVLSCLFPGMQAKIVQDLIVTGHDMFLYLEKCV